MIIRMVFPTTIVGMAKPARGPIQARIRAYASSYAVKGRASTPRVAILARLLRY